MKLSQKAEKAIKTLTDQYLETATAIAMADMTRQVLDGFSKPLNLGEPKPHVLNGAAVGRILKKGGPKEAKPAKAPKARRRSRVPVDYAPLVPKLVEMIHKSAGKKVASSEVRQALRLSPFQCRALVALAVKQRLVRVEGKRRGTTYRLGPKITKKAA